MSYKRCASTRSTRARTYATCVVVVVPLLIVIAFMSRERITARKIRSALQDLRASGEPASFHELQEMRRLDDVTTRRWLEALEFFQADRFQAVAGRLPILNGSAVPKPGDAWPDGELYRDALAMYDSARSRVDARTERVVGTEWEIGPIHDDDLPLAHVRAIHAVARLHTLKAHVAACDSDAEGAARALEDVLTLAQSISGEPYAAAHTARIAIDRLAYAGIRDFLPILQQDDLLKLRRALESTNYRQELRNAMMGERVLGFMVFQSARPLDDVRLPTLQDDQLKYLELSSALVDATRKSWAKALGTAMFISLEDLKWEGTLDEWRFARTIHLKGDSNPFFATATAETFRRLTIVAIAIEVFKRQNGRLPLGVDDLVPESLPEWPSDPFSDEPLRFVVSEESVRVYSIGADFADGKGDEEDVVIDFPFDDRAR